MTTIKRLPLAAAVALVCSTAGAQENYEIQVYPSATAAPHTTLFELHSNWTGSGTRTSSGSVLPSHHALHETLEITHGFSEIFEVGFYLFGSRNTGEGFQFVGTHIRPRVRAPDSWGLPVGLSLSTELGPTGKQFDANAWGIELRPIVDQQIGALYWAFNPNLEWALKGPDAGQGIDGMTLNPSLKFAWRVTGKYAAGIEYYGSTGTLTRMAPAQSQLHMLYPTLDFYLAPEWELNVGYGVRIAGRGDENIMKVIFGRRLDF